ncbi:MAG: hypothetical protein ACRYGL_14610 [Janthinobacterium lividum]
MMAPEGIFHFCLNIPKKYDAERAMHHFESESATIWKMCRQHPILPGPDRVIDETRLITFGLFDFRLNTGGKWTGGQWRKKVAF